MIDTSTAQLFFALLTVLAMVGTVVLIGFRIAARSSAAARGVIEAVAVVRNPLAAAVAVTCTLGSLYFSEIANFVPCLYCWYQRIAMYPLAVILVVASIRREDVRWYVVPLAGIGLLVSAYHRTIERFPDLAGDTCAAVGPPCTSVWFTEFGFITLAVMAFVGFASIITLVTLPQESPDGDVEAAHPHPEAQ